MFSLRKDLAGLVFDLRHGVDTNRKVPRDGLTGIPPGTRRHAGEYAPSNPSLLRRVIRESRLDPRDFAFVDLGCGKARVLIAAAAYPFRSILGVEADAALCEIAGRNLERLGLPAGGISVVHGDARTSELPDGNLFLFLYNPFRGPVFDAVARRLATLAQEPGRAIIIAYSQDKEAELLERTGAFLRVRLRRRQFWRRSTVSLFFNESAARMRR